MSSIINTNSIPDITVPIISASSTSGVSSSSGVISSTTPTISSIVATSDIAIPFISASSSSGVMSSTIPTSSSLTSAPIQLNPFPPPKKEDEEEVWQKYLEDSSIWFEGVDPRDAQIIFLGDDHGEKWQKQWRGAIMEHYGSNFKNVADVALCEARQAYTAIPSAQVSSFSTSKKIDSYGWDDMVTYKSEEGLIVKFSEFWKNRHEPPSQDELMTWKTLSLQLNETCMLRSQSLIKTAKVFLWQNLKPWQKLFVIAGSDHLFQPDNTVTWHSASFEEQEYNILDYFKGIKACIILPQCLNNNDEAQLACMEKIVDKSKSSLH